MQAVAERLEVTPAQVGLAWLLARSPNILLIPGTSSPTHLEENVAAGSVQLDADALAEARTRGGLKSAVTAGRPVPFSPSEQPQLLLQYGRVS